MRHTYETNNTCSAKIEFNLDTNNKVSDVKFHGGCQGNLKSISTLVENCDAKWIIEKLKDIKCGDKQTSCGAQLALALQQAMNYN